MTMRTILALAAMVVLALAIAFPAAAVPDVAPETDTVGADELVDRGDNDLGQAIGRWQVERNSIALDNLKPWVQGQVQMASEQCPPGQEPAKYELSGSEGWQTEGGAAAVGTLYACLDAGS